MKDKELDEKIAVFKDEFLKTKQEKEKQQRLFQEKEELERAKEIIREFDAADIDEMGNYESRYNKYSWAVNIIQREIARKTRKATAEDYIEWLRGYLKKGGTPTGYYDYPMPNENWRVATRDFDLAPIPRSATNIIIPTGINFNGDVDDLGLSNLYFMKDYSHTGDGSVLIFSNVRFQKRVKIETIKEIFRRWFHAL